MTKRSKPGPSSVSEIAVRLKEVALSMSPIRGAALREPGSYGAIKADIPTGSIRGPDPEFAMLFDDDALEIALRRFEEIGLPELLDCSHLTSMGRDQISQQIARALNAEKCDAQEFDPAENEAWFLVSFASLWLHTGLADPAMAEPIRADESGRPLDLARVLDLRRCLALIEFGRLLEWWRFRSKGHDAEAESRQRSSAKLDISTANDDRVADAKEWHAEARAVAQRIRKQKPDLKSKRRLAQFVIKKLQDGDPEFDKSERTVRRVIRNI